MANANVKEFTDTNFQSEVLDAKVPVLVDFWAEWCGPCKQLGPTIDELANDFVGKVKVGKMDTDANHEAAVKYQINAIPTIIIFKNGQVAKRLVGFKHKPELAAALDEVSR
jgi:thioredoxin 1